MDVKKVDAVSKAYAILIKVELREFHFSFACEAELQAGIAEALADKWGWKREAEIPGAGTIDFLHRAWEVGIECKVDGAAPAVARQVLRYLSSGAVEVLILATSRRKHALLLQDDPRVVILELWDGGLR